jgi:hypothetical protein
MSKLAQQLPTAETITTRTRRGPSGACDVYGDGDLDDCRAVDKLRRSTTWATAQRAVDETLGVRPIDENKFRYHWRRKCWHWTEEQRQVEM